MVEKIGGTERPKNKLKLTMWVARGIFRVLRGKEPFDQAKKTAENTMTTLEDENRLKVKTKTGFERALERGDRINIQTPSGNVYELWKENPGGQIYNQRAGELYLISDWENTVKIYGNEDNFVVQFDGTEISVTNAKIPYKSLIPLGRDDLEEVINL